MPGGFAWRFGLEAGFLVLLGAGAGYANLRPIVIVAVLAGGWLLVSLVELMTWMAQGRRASVVPAPPPAIGEAEHAPEPEPEPVGWPVDEPGEEPVSYPLRADAGSEPSEEIEAYTRVLETEPRGAGEPSD
jgi:hypothetical protein